jgi:DNA-directed RNA polymerase specialized sigma24 family protein
LNEVLVVSPAPRSTSSRWIASLDKLAAVDARESRVVELRFFGGLSVEETAEALRLSTDTIKRDRRLAKLRLLREIEGPRGP